MNLQGFIRSIGTPREWKTKEGESRWTYPVVITIPFIGTDGKERCDDILTDHTCGNPEYMDKLHKAMEEHTRMDFRVGFSLREWEGKQFQNARLFDLQIML